MKKIIASDVLASFKYSSESDDEILHMLQKITGEAAQKYVDAYYEYGEKDPAKAIRYGLEKAYAEKGKNFNKIGYLKVFTFLFNTWVYKLLASKTRRLADVKYKPISFQEVYDIYASMYDDMRKNGLKKLKELRRGQKITANEARMLKAAMEDFKDDYAKELWEEYAGIVRYICEFFSARATTPKVAKAIVNFVETLPVSQETKSQAIQLVLDYANLSFDSLHMITNYGTVMGLLDKYFYKIARILSAVDKLQKGEINYA